MAAEVGAKRGWQWQDLYAVSSQETEQEPPSVLCVEIGPNRTRACMFSLDESTDDGIDREILAETRVLKIPKHDTKLSQDQWLEYNVKNLFDPKTDSHLTNLVLTRNIQQISIAVLPASSPEMAIPNIKKEIQAQAAALAEMKNLEKISVTIMSSSSAWFAGAMSARFLARSLADCTFPYLAVTFGENVGVSFVDLSVDGQMKVTSLEGSLKRLEYRNIKRFLSPEELKEFPPNLVTKKYLTRICNERGYGGIEDLMYRGRYKNTFESHATNLVKDIWFELCNSVRSEQKPTVVIGGGNSHYLNCFRLKHFSSRVVHNLRVAHVGLEADIISLAGCAYLEAEESLKTEESPTPSSPVAAAAGAPVLSQDTPAPSRTPSKQLEGRAAVHLIEN